MARSVTTQNLALACEAVARNARRKSRMQRMRRRLDRCAAGVSTCALGITFAAMAAAQSAENFKVAPTSAEGESGETFQLAPLSPEAAAAAAAAPYMIFGVSSNIIIFVAAGVIAVLWFTLGGGRKSKVTRHG